MFCRVKGCIKPSHRGFRKCMDCLRGLTPDKIKEMKESEEE